MAETNEVAKTSVPNQNDRMQIYGEVLPCCLPNRDDSIEPQEELHVMLAPFQGYCRLESSTQKKQLHQIKEQLSKVLSDEKAKYESLHNKNPRQLRKKWRDRRIKIYDYLLRLALYDPEQNEDLWIEEQKLTDHFYVEATLKLEPERFYTYLVDQVHEDEEIMFKYYCVDKGVEKPFEWRKDAPWLVGSINIYLDTLIGEALNAMRPWDDRDQPLCDDLVKLAKEKFVDKLSSLHGRCFKKERNWRNRARFYYLLGLARHTGISNGHAERLKNSDYEGPFSRLVREMIVEDEDLFHQENGGQDLLLICKTKYKKHNNRSLTLGHLKVDRLLAWASAANDLGFVKVLLKYYLDNVEVILPSRVDFVEKKSIGQSWAMALWNASYKGHTRIVKELLSWKNPYIFEYLPDKTIHSEPPLHMNILRRDVSAVHAFCTTASPHLNCNEKNSSGFTPLEIATKLEETNDNNIAIKRKIQNLLLQRQEVKDAVAEAINQRQMVVDSSNAVMVGGTLIASITFAGWLQPPLGYNSYYQFLEPVAAAAPPNSYESYMSVQGHFTIQLFAIFNSLSFFLAIAAVVAGMETLDSIKVVQDIYMATTILKLRRRLNWSTSLFLNSVICVLAAFSCAGIAILPPIKQYQTNMYITIAIGGFICSFFICKMLWFSFGLSKRFRISFYRH